MWTNKNKKSKEGDGTALENRIEMEWITLRSKLRIFHLKRIIKT